MTAPVNIEQLEYWNGEQSREWVEQPCRFDEMLAPFSEHALDRARLESGDRVLDVGCGNGAMTLDAARRVAPDGAAVGIDLSEPMLGVARTRADEGGITNASFVMGDAQVADLDGTFDALLSRFGIMFFEDPDAAFANLAASLCPGGRVVLVAWCPVPDNEWVVVPMGAVLSQIGDEAGALPPPGSPGPFRYGDPAPLVASLEGAGLLDVDAEKFEPKLLLGGRGTFDEVCAFVSLGGMARAVLGECSPATRERALAAIAESLAPYATDDGVRMGAAAWIVTARAR